MKLFCHVLLHRRLQPAATSLHSTLPRKTAEPTSPASNTNMTLNVTHNRLHALGIPLVLVLPLVLLVPTNTLVSLSFSPSLSSASSSCRRCRVSIPSSKSGTAFSASCFFFPCFGMITDYTWQVQCGF